MEACKSETVQVSERNKNEELTGREAAELAGFKEWKKKIFMKFILLTISSFLRFMTFGLYLYR